MLRIRISSLKPGLHEYSLQPAAADLDLDPERFEDVQVEAVLDYSGERILVTFTVSAVATLECDRTLRLFKQEVEGSYSVLFAPPSVAGEEEDEPLEDVRPLTANDQEIDITDAVRDTLLLAVPLRKIAPGAEEEPLPTRFGAPAGPALDPRWEALRGLADGDDAR